MMLRIEEIFPRLVQTHKVSAKTHAWKIDRAESAGADAILHTPDMKHTLPSIAMRDKAVTVC